MNGLGGLIGTDAPPVVTGLELDELCALIGNERRRVIVRAVAEHGELSKAALAECLAYVERGSGYSTQARKAIYVSLHQVHVDRLRECGVLVGADDALAAGPNHAAVLAAIDELARRVGGEGA